MVRRILRDIIIGATSTGAVTDRKDTVSEVHSKTAIVVERHQFQESIELLNAMRRVGGVRRIGKGTTDAGEPIGQISERVLRHTGFDQLHDHIKNDTDYDPKEAPQWGRFGTAVLSETPMNSDDLTRMQATAEQKRRAAVEVHGPTNVRTLQDELFGR